MNKSKFILGGGIIGSVIAIVGKNIADKSNESYRERMTSNIDYDNLDTSYAKEPTKEPTKEVISWLASGNVKTNIYGALTSEVEGGGCSKKLLCSIAKDYYDNVLSVNTSVDVYTDISSAVWLQAKGLLYKAKSKAHKNKIACSVNRIINGVCKEIKNLQRKG